MDAHQIRLASALNREQWNLITSDLSDNYYLFSSFVSQNEGVHSITELPTDGLWMPYLLAEHLYKIKNRFIENQQKAIACIEPPTLAPFYNNLNRQQQEFNAQLASFYYSQAIEMG